MDLQKETAVMFLPLKTPSGFESPCEVVNLQEGHIDM